MTAVNSLARPELLGAGLEVEGFKTVEVCVKVSVSFSPGFSPVLKFIALREPF